MRRRGQDHDSGWKYALESWSPNDVSLRNPWIIATISCSALVILVIAAMLLFGLPKEVASLIVRIVWCGFFGALFLYELRKRAWMRAVVMAALLFTSFLGC